jgi:hypothetical protein
MISLSVGLWRGFPEGVTLCRVMRKPEGILVKLALRGRPPGGRIHRGKGPSRPILPPAQMSQKAIQPSGSAVAWT